LKIRAFQSAPRGGVSIFVLLGAVSASIAMAASCGSADVPEPAACTQTSSTEIFDQRIAPLLADDRPKSCNACHLSGIDMTLFVRSTPCETMACLSQLGLVDLGSPSESKVLGWIQRAAPLSPLITGDVIAAEHAGFLEWIEHHALCGRFECAGVRCGERRTDPFCEVADEPDQATGPELDIGGCSDLAIERLFRDSIYASRGRCFPCHFSSEEAAAPGAPRFIDQEGTCDSSSLSTLRNIVDAGLINLADPAASLLLLKPLSEEGGGVPHGGHAKFFPGSDPGYDNFLYWVTRYAECQRTKG
jgi:hypothetical protein